MSENNKSAINKNLKYVFLIIGILAVGLSYFLVFSKYQTKISDIDDEISTLDAQYSDLKAKDANRDEIIKQTKEVIADYEEILGKFNTSLSYQSEIMDAYNMTQNINIKVPSLGLSSISDVYTFADTSHGYKGIATSYVLSTIGTYDQMKETINYIMNEKGKRKVPTSIAYSYNTTTQEVALNINVTEYAVVGDDREVQEITVPGYEKSIPNVFYNMVIEG